jgi:hypothetical protein
VGIPREDEARGVGQMLTRQSALHQSCQQLLSAVRDVGNEADLFRRQDALGFGAG